MAIQDLSMSDAGKSIGLSGMLLSLSYMIVYAKIISKRNQLK